MPRKTIKPKRDRGGRFAVKKRRRPKLELVKEPIKVNLTIISGAVEVGLHDGLEALSDVGDMALELTGERSYVVNDDKSNPVRGVKLVDLYTDVTRLNKVLDAALKNIARLKEVLMPDGPDNEAKVK